MAAAAAVAKATVETMEKAMVEATADAAATKATAATMGGAQ